MDDNNKILIEVVICDANAYEIELYDYFDSVDELEERLDDLRKYIKEGYDSEI